jgi:hypothetical protein
MSAASTIASAHSNRAVRDAVRRLIPPTPRSWSFASSVTTLLYSTTVPKSLRGALRSSRLWSNSAHATTSCSHLSRSFGSGARRGLGASARRLLLGDILRHLRLPLRPLIALPRRVGVLLVYKSPDAMPRLSFIRSIRLIYGQKREPTSGLEPLTPAPATSDNSGVAGVCTSLQIPHI